MEKTTIAGLLFGAFCVIVSIMLDGDILVYINIPSIFIVVGGVLAATMVSYPTKVLLNVIKVMKNAFVEHNVDLNEDVELIIKIANVARREGVLALENEIHEIDDPFLRKGIMLIVDGTDPQTVRDIMETDLSFIKERHNQGQAVLYTMSAFSPAFGMVGTLIGLINMLRSLDDVATLGPSMAVALITTLYGVLLANLIFTPLAKKLKFMSDEEELRQELLLEGMLSIQDGENPRLIREKLNSFLSYSQVDDINAAQSGAAREARA